MRGRKKFERRYLEWGRGREREGEREGSEREIQGLEVSEGVSSIHYRRLPLNGIFVSSSSHCPSSPNRGNFCFAEQREVVCTQGRAIQIHQRRVVTCIRPWFPLLLVLSLRSTSHFDLTIDCNPFYFFGYSFYLRIREIYNFYCNKFINRIFHVRFLINRVNELSILRRWKRIIYNCKN